jgi:hypothetical protein
MRCGRWRSRSIERKAAVYIEQRHRQYAGHRSPTSVSAMAFQRCLSGRVGADLLI